MTTTVTKFMKTHRQSCTFLLALCGLVLSQSARADTNALKLRFAFDATPVNNVIVDTLGRHPGIVAGAQWAATEDIRSGVMHFTVPVVPQITIAPTADFDGTVGSIAFWMKSGTNNTASGNAGAILFDRRSTSGDVIVLQDNGTLSIQTLAPGGGLANTITTTKTVNDNQWHHIAYVFDQSDTGQIQIYIDGVLDKGSPNTQAWAWDSAQEIELGLSHDSYWRAYIGSLDDFMWYNRALAPAEVATLAAGTVDTSGLVCRLNFDAAPVNGVLLDSSPAGLNPGTDVGATWAASVAGRNGVMEFTHYPANQITVPPAAELNSPTGTIAFWVKTTAAGTAAGNYVMLYDRRTGPGDVITITDSGTLSVQATASAGVVVNSFSGYTPVNDGNWHHIAYVYDQTASGSTTLYVDGNYDNSGAPTAAWSWPASQEIELGLSHDAWWHPFEGSLDDFQIYDQALTQAQIQYIYTNAVGAIMPDPLITLQPQSAMVPPGTAVNLSVAATGTGTLSYQWQKNDTNLTGQASATLSLPSVAYTDSGNYRCVVNSSVGQSISLEATLSVEFKPVILTQPAPYTTYPGATAFFSVAADGGQLQYQWKKAGSTITGATNATLILTNVTPADAVDYSSTVSNAAGSTISANAHLTVVVTPGGYLGAVLADSPVAYWRLDEPFGTIAYDRADHTGIYSGAYTLGTPGFTADGDTAVTFSGGTATVPYSDDLNPTNFTVEFWAKPADLTGEYVVALQDRTTGSRLGYALQKNYFTSGWDFSFGTDPANYNTISSGTPVNPGSVYHVVATYDGANANLYVNGVLTASTNTTYQPANPGAVAFTMASRNGSNPYVGILDEVAVYRYALTLAQVQDHFFQTLQIAMTPVNGIVLDSKPTGAPVDGLNAGAIWATSDTDLAGTQRTGVMQFFSNAVSQVTVNPAPAFNSPTGTITFWVKTTQAGTASGHYVMLYDRRSGPGDVITITDSGTLFVQATAAASGVANSFSGSTPVNDGNWHLIAYVYDQSASGSTTLYVDGNYDNQQAPSQAWSWDASQEIELGRSHDSWWLTLQGSLDDVMVYDRMLSQAEIQAAVAGAPVTDSSVVGRYNFDAAPVPGYRLSTLVPATIQRATNVTGPYTDLGPSPQLHVPAAGNHFFRAKD